MANRLRKTLVGISAAGLAAVVLCTALLWVAGDVLLRGALGYGAERAGFRVVALERAALAWRAGAISLAGLELARAGQAPLRLSSLDLRIDWRALLDGRLLVPSVALRGLSIEIEKRADGTLLLSGLALGGDDAGSPASPPPVGIVQAEISDARLVYRDGTTRTHLTVERLSLARFDFDDPKAALRFDMAAALDGAHFKLRGTADLAASSFAGRFEASAFDLAAVARQAKRDLAGTLDAAFDVALAEKAGALEVSLAGRAAIANLATAGMSAAAATWTGRLVWNDRTGLALDGATALQQVAASFDDTTLAAERLAHRGDLSVASDGAVALDGAVQAEKLALRRADLAFDAAALSAEAFGVRRAATGAVALRTRIAALAPSVVAGQTKIAAAKLDLARLEANVSAAGDAALSLALAAAALEIAAAGTAVSLGTFAADGALSLAGDLARFEGSANLGTAKLLSAEATAAFARANFRGVAVREGASLRSDGSLALERAEADLKAAKLAAKLGTLRHEGAAILAPTPALSGRLTGSEVAIDAADGRQLAAIGSFEASGLAADTGGTRAPHVDLGNLRVLRRVRAGAGQPAFPWRIEAPRATLRDLKIDGTSAVAVGDARIERPTLRLTRVKGGWLSLDTSEPAADATLVPAGAPAALRFAVGRLALANGSAVFEDRALEAPVRVALDRIEFAASDIDNARPERPVAFSLDARVGRFGSAKAFGTAFAFAPKLSFDLELQASAIDLPPLSAYVDAALGVDLRTGTGDVSLKLAARDAVLGGTTSWRFANLRLDERDPMPDGPAKYPVATALSLLADSNGDIRLEIPVSGPLDDPQFDTADAVRQAVGGALESALSATLTVLFPIGAIFSSAADAEKRGTSIALPALEFERGQSALGAAANRQLAALARLLEARPAARLEACGFAVPGDIDKGSESDLVELAQARAGAVKQRLVDADRVAAARIFECRATVDDAPGAAPRVETRFQ